VVDAAGVIDYLREEDAMVQQVTFHIDALDKDLAVLVWRTFPAHSARELEAGSSEAGQITA
jgi:hypothetical protein